MAYFFCVAAAAGNLLAAVYTASMADGTPIHVFAHVALAGIFGLAARQLGRAPRGRHSDDDIEDKHEEEVLMLHENMSDLERELQETRARLEFADQLLKNKQEDKS